MRPVFSIRESDAHRHKIKEETKMSDINRNPELSGEEMEEVSGGVYGNGSVTIIEYTVVRGDTLGRLANRFNTSVNSIMKLNPIIKNKNLIVTGWKLQIRVNDR